MIKMFRYLLVALGLLLSVQAKAGVPCTLPFTFSNGTIADATQVNANYNALVTCLNNAAAAGVNFDITTITGLTTPLSTSQGGTSVGTHTTGGILYGQGTGAIGSARCTMGVSSDNSISCSSSVAFRPEPTVTNTTNDSNNGFYTVIKNRAGADSQNGDSLGTFQAKGTAGGVATNSGQFTCIQNAAISGSTVPTRCQIRSSSVALGPLGVNFIFPTTNGTNLQFAQTDGSGNVSWAFPTAPTKQYLTATGTYTTPAGARTIFIQECGGGAGGAGASANNGTNGNATTFNGITANGGTGGQPAGGRGGAGGTGGAGATSLRVNGGGGGAGTGANGLAGIGGSGYFGGGGVGGSGIAAGNGGQCAGGGGGSQASAGGGGGGSGEYVEFSITSPAATYAITVGGTAAGGAAGTQAGGIGGAGLIIVTEFYLRALRCEIANDNEDVDACKAA